jgi:hypothetical protein
MVKIGCPSRSIGKDEYAFYILQSNKSVSKTIMVGPMNQPQASVQIANIKLLWESFFSVYTFYLAYV